MKKAFCLILAMLLLTSCSQGGVNEEEESGDTTSDTMAEANETESESEEILSGPEIQNLDGAEAVILNYTPESFSWANTQIFAEEMTGETLNDALYSRERKTEEGFGCLITELAASDVGGTFKHSVTAQDDNFSCSMMFDASVADMLIGGFVMSWDELDELDLSNVWWDNAATEQYSLSGIQAAVSGAFSLYNYSTRHCYVVNAELLENVNPGYNIYTTVREGKWTMDELYGLGAMAVIDLDGNGEMEYDADQYGIVGSAVRHYSALLAGADCKYIDKDSEGKVFFNVPGNESMINIMTKIVNLDSGNYIYSSGDSGIGGGAEVPTFYDGRALFSAAYVGEAAKMREVEFKIGIVPPPKADEAQDSYHSLVEGGAQTLLPKTLPSDKYHSTAVILDAFSYYSFVESIPAYIDVVLMTKVARDEESSEMLGIVFDNSFYDLGTGVWSGQTKNVYTSSVFLPKSDKIASTTEKNLKLINKNLEAFEKKLSELAQ